MAGDAHGAGRPARWGRCTHCPQRVGRAHAQSHPPPCPPFPIPRLRFRVGRVGDAHVAQSHPPPCPPFSIPQSRWAGRSHHAAAENIPRRRGRPPQNRRADVCRGHGGRMQAEIELRRGRSPPNPDASSAAGTEGRACWPWTPGGRRRSVPRRRIRRRPRPPDSVVPVQVQTVPVFTGVADDFRNSGAMEYRIGHFGHGILRLS